MMTPFLNPNDEAHFIQHGYVTFPLLQSEELVAIRDIYDEVNRANRLHQQQFYGVNYSLGTLTAEENNRVMLPVLNIIKQPLQDRFKDFELIGCVFITKPPKTLTTFIYHQDWSYTDEKSHAFATCWVPLFDTNTQNGCMSLIGGSHRHFNTYRSDTLDSARIDFDSIPKEVRTDIEQSAGSCLAFHQAVFHGSYPNKSDHSRPVLAFVVKHITSPVIHYVKESEAIAAYQMPVEAFNNMLMQIPKSTMPESAQRITTITLFDELPTAASLSYLWRVENHAHRLLKNETLHRNFQRDGFIVLKNVLPLENVEQLCSIYHGNFVTPQGMYVTHHSETDATRNKNYSQRIFTLLEPFLNKQFTAYRELISHFAVKGAGVEGLFNLHQDWSIVREELFGVIHCWVPLQKVSKQNGTLAVLPGSHLCFHNYRSGTCPIRFLSISAFGNKVTHINADVGDVVLYHPALFHGSGENHSHTDRLAVVAAIANNTARTVYHNRVNNEVLLYELTEQDLYARLDDLAKGAAPLGQVIEPVQPRILDGTDEQIIKRLLEFCKMKTTLHAEV